MLHLVLLLSPVFASIYYVSPTGNDNNAGTSSSSPWVSTKRVNNQRLKPGDSVLFQSDVVHANANLVFLQGGDPGTPVIVGSYQGNEPGGQAILNAGNGSGVMVSNCGGIEIYNLTLIGARKNISQAPGIFLLSEQGGKLKHIKIENVQTDGFLFGILLEGGGDQCQDGFVDVLLNRVNCHDAFSDNVRFGGSFKPCFAHQNVTVLNSYFSNSVQMNGLTISNVDGALVSGCTAFQNGAGNPNGGPYGIWAWNANNVVFSHCVSYHNHNGGTSGTPFSDGGGFDFDGGVTNSLMEYCFSFQNDGPGFGIYQFPYNVFPTKNNTIRFSVSFGDNMNTGNRGTASFFSPDATLSNIHFVSNTFIMFPTDPISGIAATVDSTFPVANATFSNNAFITSGSAPFLLWAGPYPGLNFSGNSYWSLTLQPSYQWCPNEQCQTFIALDDFRAATGQERNAKGEATGTDANPGLIASTDFFQSCVPWVPLLYPQLPNSAFLDAIRSFQGC